MLRLFCQSYSYLFIQISRLSNHCFAQVTGQFSWDGEKTVQQLCSFGCAVSDFNRQVPKYEQKHQSQFHQELKSWLPKCSISILKKEIYT